MQPVNEFFKIILYFILYSLTINQRQLYFNNEYNSKQRLLQTSSYRRSGILMKGIIRIYCFIYLYEIFFI
jgi:hypothetical protein